MIKAYLNAGEINKAIEVQSEISNLQKQNQLERGDSLYYWKYSTVLYIKQNQYENAAEAQKKLAVCVKKSSRYWQCTSFYLEAVLANVKGDHHKAELLCNNMEQYVRPIADIGELDRSEQAYWYMLFTQKTVAWWGLGKQKEALKLVIEIGDFPYWKTCSTSSICSRILKTYQNNEMLENEKIVVYEREIGKLKTSLWY